jgi:hypothetical protein
MGSRIKLMSKSIIAAAAFALLVTAAPAFAQDAACPAKGFDGPHGSATNLRDTPSSDPTAANPGRPKGFDGPHGSATNLRDAPRKDETAGMLLPAIQKVREAANRSRSGVTKAGTGTLVLAGTARACK